MKKAKSLMAILAMVFAFLGVVLFALVPLFNAMGLNMTGTETNVMEYFTENVGGILDRAKTAIDFKALFDGFDIMANMPQFIVLVGGAVLFVLFVVLFIMLLVKKHAKGLGLAIPTFLLGLVAVVGLAMMLVKDNVLTETLYTVVELKYLGIGALALAGLGVLCAVLFFIFYLVYVAGLKVEKKAKEEKPEEAVPAEGEEVKVEEAVKSEVAETVVAEKAPETVVAETPEEKPAVVVRRILVHKTGKVVRVLNEHYFDVTTNIYVDPVVNDPNAPQETEQQHYEKIFEAAKEPAPQPKPAPVVVEEVKPEPVVEPAPKVKVVRIPFAVRLKKSEKSVKETYNELKAELLSYGLKSRISIAGDTFRLHTKTYAKIVMAGKSLKMYFALNPKDYKDSTFPVNDASEKTVHEDTPLSLKVKSDLSVRRAKILIADCAKVDGIEQGEVVKHDYAKEVK